LSPKKTLCPQNISLNDYVTIVTKLIDGVIKFFVTVRVYGKQQNLINGIGEN
jgi:hypothetical protein